MAEKALQKVEEELTTCSICLDTYTNPKLLQCFHVYCQGCLTRLAFRDQQKQLVLTCPNCRQVTPVPAGGVAGLQSAFHINYLLGIVGEHKKSKDESAHAENSSPINVPQAKVTHYCSEHPNEEVKLYCETCRNLICFKCVIKHGEHHDHDYALLDQAFEKYKEEISLSLQPVEKQMATIKQARQQLHTCCGKINEQQAIIEADILSSIGRLQEILEVRKTQLISRLHQITQSKLKSLAAHDDQLETTEAQLGSCLNYMKKSMETNSHHIDMLKMKTRVVWQVEELTAPLQPDLLKPCTDADLLYSESATTLADCQTYGLLSGPDLEDPSRCYATGSGLEVASVEEISTIILHAVNCKGEPCVYQINSLECELISEITGTRVLGRVERIEQSKYEISYQPTIKGRHLLHIKAEGQHIMGSPFSVLVKSSIQNLGTPFHSIWGMDGPFGVALTDKEELVVSDHCDHHIHLFSFDGQKLLSFGSYGSNTGQFKYPAGVAVDKDRNILVVDYENHRVQKFTKSGQFITAVGSKGKKHLQFDAPYDVAFNPSNNKVYVTDSKNHRVQCLNLDFTFYKSFGSYGTDEGQFAFPCRIACDSTGNLYVIDHSDRVQIFTARGKFLRFINHRLQSSAGIAVDTSDTVYISGNNRQHHISVLTPDGQLVKTFGIHGNEPGQLKSSRGLAVDGNGVVYVCDITNNCIQMF